MRYIRLFISEWCVVHCIRVFIQCCKYTCIRMFDLTRCTVLNHNYTNKLLYHVIVYFLKEIFLMLHHLTMLKLESEIFSCMLAQICSQSRR